MAKKVVFLVFLLPVIFSLIFGSAVLGEVLTKPDRELNMWNFSFSDSKVIKHNNIEILGLQNQYTPIIPVEIMVKINTPTFDCGDFYITIYDLNSVPKQVLTQAGFFDQCYEANSNLLPIDDEFSVFVDKPGSYEIVVEINDKQQKIKDSISTKFTVK